MSKRPSTLHRPFLRLLPALAVGLALTAPLPAQGLRTPVPPTTVPANGGSVFTDSHPTDEVAETLAAFGVSSEETPRLDEQGQELGGDYAPLGADLALDRIGELVIVGLDQPGDDFQRSFFLYQDGQAGPQPGGWYDVPVLYGMGENEMEDIRPATAAGSAPQSYRAVGSADVDGDGREEILVLHLLGAELRLRVVQDEAEAHAVTEYLVTVDAEIDDVAVAGTDMDGDGKAEVLAAWAVDGVAATLAALKIDEVGINTLKTTDVAPEIGGSRFSLVLETGNVDNDVRGEVLVIVDENADPMGLCRWAIFDDGLADMAFLAGGPLTSIDMGIERTAVVGDGALGDIDGDGRDELVFAGLTAFTQGCEQPDYLVLALDDAEFGFGELGTRHFHYDYAACNSTPKMVRWAHVNTGDIDGDGRDEIQMNQWIYDDWVAGGTWTETWSMPDAVVMAGTSWQYFDRSTSAFCMGDYTGDGRDDVLAVRAGIHGVHVYGFDPLDPSMTFEEQGFVEAESYNASSGFRNPLLLSVNVDDDSAILSYSEGQHDLLFTEPFILAALAAPPYQAGIQQNYGACSTAFGNTTSTGSEEELSVSLSAGVSVGVNIDGGAITQAEFELTEKLTVAATHFAGHSYQLDKTILFQSGWDEDLVVFTTIPMDVYTYRVLSHPDPELVGRDVVLRFPRDPVLIQASREYYNAHVFEGGMRVDDTVFQHTLGDVSSYPTAAEKNALLAANGGLEHGPISVGQGSGQTSATIQVSESWNEGNALEMSYELEVKATGGGVMGGFTVGSSAAASLSVSSGTQTTYTGTVGAIAAPDFADNFYQFGLFTYVQLEPVRGYEFEVLNYWVQ